MKLLAYLNLRGVLTCETGLLIGGTETFGIGGIDKLMIRESFRGKRPYIPGSSLKGKMRHLMEQRHQNELTKDNPTKSRDAKEVHSCDNAVCPVCRVFGTAAENAKTVTRLIVRDARLITSEDDAPTHALPALQAYLDSVRDYQEHSGGYTEVKTENVINRIKGSAEKPRHFERVPAGMKFALDLSYRVFADDHETPVAPSATALNNTDVKNFHEVIQALQLVAQDYLGASGSRGYGRVSFSLLHGKLLNASNLKELWKQNIDLASWKPEDVGELIKAMAELEPAAVKPQTAEPPPESALKTAAADSQLIEGAP
jgi:CRISPR-associated protein Csm3